MTYHRHKTDLNQVEIVKAFRSMGASVADLSGCKVPGFPDLLIGFRGVNILVEVKNEKGLNKISEVQKNFALTWQGGQVHYVRTADEAVSILQNLMKG